MSSRFRQKVETPTILSPEDLIVQFPAAISIGGFLINTNPSTGAVEVKPTNAPNQAPSPAAQPVSLVLDASGMMIQSTAEFGGRVLLESLLNNLLDLNISFPQLETQMPLRSLFGSILTRLSAVETFDSAADIRLAAEEAKSAADDVREALQDASGTLLQLAIATAQSDLSGVIQRVSALESAPGFDATAINATIADLSGVAHLAATTAQGAAADVLAAAGAIADLSGNVNPRVAAVEAWNAGSRLDAVEAGVASKVAQADYDTYVAATDAAIAAKADASALADYALSANVEEKGRLTEIESEVISFTGINSGYWAGLITGIRLTVEAGKLAIVDYNDGAGLSFFLGLAPATNQAYRVKNAGTYAISINPGSEAAPAPEPIEVQPGETITFVWNGTAWILV